MNKFINTILLSVCLIGACLTEYSPDYKVTLFIFNSSDDWPSQIQEETFWGVEGTLDSIIIGGPHLSTLVAGRLYNLSDSNIIESYAEWMFFAHQYAIVINCGSNVDTFYGNYKFGLIKSKTDKRVYTNTDPLLNNLFGNLMVLD